VTDDVTRTGRGVPTTPTQRQRQRRWAGIKPEFVIGAAVVIAVAMMVIVVWVFDGPDSKPAPEGAFMIAGNVLVSGSGTNLAFGNSVDECRGKAGYEDLHEGAKVVVANASGETVAIGRLGAGKSTTSGGANGSVARLVACTFPIEVRDVPDGAAFYQVTVTHRGTQQYTRDQLREPISLTLG
jgi:hypothetical protein